MKNFQVLIIGAVATIFFLSVPFGESSRRDMPGNSALLHARGIYFSFAGSGSGKKSSPDRISSDVDGRVITATGTGMVIEKRYDIAKKKRCL